MSTLASLRLAEATWKARHTFRQTRLVTWQRRESKTYHAWKHLRDTRPERDAGRAREYGNYTKATAAVAKWTKLRDQAATALEAARKGIANHRTPRQKTVNWALAQVGTKENPAGSNRGGKITQWQKRFGGWLVSQPWCGVFAANALLAGGVQNVSGRLASVALIEEDARAHKGPFRGWTTGVKDVLPGDLVVLFGAGVHVEVVEAIVGNVVHTIGGNTSTGNAGSQDNGGCVAHRSGPTARPLSAVHGFALVNFPG